MREYDRAERLLILLVPVILLWLLLFLGRRNGAPVGVGIAFTLLYPPLMYLRLRN